MTSRRPLIATPYRRWSSWWRAGLGCRLLNVLVALVGIVITLPLMLIIAVLVRLDSPGSVLYRQQRVGVDRRRRQDFGPDEGRRRQDRGGRIFTIVKFRTMREASQARQVWARRDDPRVTRIGRFLRATRLDELPQLFLVLKGDMNVVGPRPEQPRIFASLRSDVPSYRKRQRVLPGITGLAQVNRASDESLDDVRRKVEYDLEYIERRSLLQDVGIMVRTLPVMIRGLRNGRGEPRAPEVSHPGAVGVEPGAGHLFFPRHARGPVGEPTPPFSSREWWAGRPRMPSTARPPMDVLGENT